METSSIRILAVDDSVTIRKALELILVPAGFQVEFAVEGAEAIEKARRQPPDILLLDFILPDMRGTEVCSALLAGAETKHIPVVLISARGAEIRQAYHDADNVIDYLAKPFTPEAVLGVIEEVLSAQASRVKEPPAVAIAKLPPAVTPPRGVVKPPPLMEVLAQQEQAEKGHKAVEHAEEANPRGALEAMLEVLRAGLEGVYVEERGRPVAGTPSTPSHAALASHLASQLRETLQQAESALKSHLFGDGSIRSLDESLLEAYRRVCRLLFRSVAVSVAGSDPVAQARPRLLVACARGGGAHAQLAGAATALSDAHVLVVSSNFHQLPMLARLYVPTHLVVETGLAAALGEQVEILRALPEAHRMKIAAIAEPNGAGLDADAVLDPGEDLRAAVRRFLGPPATTPEPVMAHVATAAT